jgi:probable phosphoglycerate mutase
MKLLLIRHGDPDYMNDTLTARGWHEAELLADRISKLEVAAFYASPLGRARETASVTLKKIDREAAVLPWLREFHAPVIDEKTGAPHLPWDWLPADWTAVPEYYDKDLWHTSPVMRAGNVGAEAGNVCAGIDALLKNHGYERDGLLYRAVRPNMDTVALFCHFGVTCVILSHLLGVSPLVLWQGFCAAPTSVTTVVTEERRKGVTCFRVSALGDVSHLYAAGEEPAFAGRFCELYDNTDERHD